MKKMLFHIGFLCLLCSSCTHHFQYEDESHINGQLCYVANPFNQEDTILCINNVYVSFVCRGDGEYCLWARELLSQFNGKLTECRFHNTTQHSWECLANPSQYFYPVLAGQFVSLVDPRTGIIADSINLNGIVIHPKQKRPECNFRTGFYREEFILFRGNDHMQPKLITDTITPSGEKIVCFDGQRGPDGGNSSLTTSTPYIFIDE